MRKYEIYEDGQRFATIKARFGTSALRKAAREYPRYAVDYNLDPGEKIFVTWFACEPGERPEAVARITAPGTSDHGCVFHDA